RRRGPSARARLERRRLPGTPPGRGPGLMPRRRRACRPAFGHRPRPALPHVRGRSRPVALRAPGHAPASHAALPRTPLAALSTLGPVAGGLIDIATARERVLAAVQPLGTDAVPLREAPGRA